MKLNIFGSLDRTGYGIHFANFAKSIASFVDLRLYPVGPIDEAIVDDSLRGLMAQTGALDEEAMTLILWEMNDIEKFPGKRKIAYAIFELDDLSPKAWENLHKVEAVFVASSWAKTILTQGKNALPKEKIWVVPEGVDPNIFSYQETPSVKNTRPRFLNIGKIEKRKGHFALLRALEHIYAEIELVVHWHNHFVSEEAIQEILATYHWSPAGQKVLVERPSIEVECYKHRANPNVKLMRTRTSFVQTQHLKALIDSCDFGLFPYFAEGWNLPLTECMATGLPCIATDYSGPTAYLDTSTNLLLTKLHKRPAQDTMFFRHGKGNWAEVEPGEIASKICWAANHPEEMQKLRVNLSSFGQNYAWNEAAKKAYLALKQIQAGSH